MAREFKKQTERVFEDVVKESLKIIGVKVEEVKIQLFLRLILSGIAKHYFYNPDDVIDVGFLRFSKNPNKDELFKAEIIKSTENGIYNAETLWKFYTGELQQQQQCRKILDKFLNDLIKYSQEQEENITKLTSRLKERKKRRE